MPQMGLTANEPARLSRAEVPGSPSHPCTTAAAVRKRHGELAPLLWQEGGKGLQSWNDPSSATTHGRVRDTDLPGPPSFHADGQCPRCWSLRQSQPRRPCNKARALCPSTLHPTARQAHTASSSHPTCRKRHLHSQASCESKQARESRSGAAAWGLESTAAAC